MVIYWIPRIRKLLALDHVSFQNFSLSCVISLFISIVQSLKNGDSRKQTLPFTDGSAQAAEERGRRRAQRPAPRPHCPGRAPRGCAGGPERTRLSCSGRRRGGRGRPLLRRRPLPPPAARAAPRGPRRPVPRRPGLHGGRAPRPGPAAWPPSSSGERRGARVLPARRGDAGGSSARPSVPRSAWGTLPSRPPPPPAERGFSGEARARRPPADRGAPHRLASPSAPGSGSRRPLFLSTIAPPQPLREIWRAPPTLARPGSAPPPNQEARRAAPRRAPIATGARGAAAR